MLNLSQLKRMITQIMTNKVSREIIKAFNSYVDTYRDSAGTLHPMQQLKLTHTLHVVRETQAIMRGEGWSADDGPTGEIVAILHDIGRFSQFAEFDTFRDSESVDHAKRGAAVIKKLNMLAGASSGTAKKIIKAILWHNKKRVPAGEDSATTALAHLIRDADKLDIFRVMERAVKDGSIENNPEITWGLDITGAPNPELVKSILAGKAVDYSLITGLSDFILIQIGWIINGFHYDTALRVVKERNVIPFRRDFLKTLTDDSAIDRCCDAAEAVVEGVGGVVMGR